MPQTRRTLAHVTGCLVAGAAGDALGAPVEFMPLDRIRRDFGPDGVVDYIPAYGRKGAITDDTQMTLFTAEGLILSQVRCIEGGVSDMVPFVYQAYLRWLTTQRMVDQESMIRQHGACVMVEGQLMMCSELHARRAPGNSCLTALKSGTMGTTAEPVNNSKGCGGVMRIAPVGYFLPPDRVFDTACRIAAITHGHPTGYLAAGCLAEIISRISYGADLPAAIMDAMEVLRKHPDHDETLAAVRSALEAMENKPVSAETVETLGQGWIAEEALAIGLYCALAAGEDVEKGLRLAVNHGGDSDSTGAIAGNLLGALWGIGSVPAAYLDELELLALIRETASDLYQRMPDREGQGE